MSKTYDGCCPICSMEFSTNNPRQKTCGSPYCVAENNRRRARENAKAHRIRGKKYRNPPFLREFTCPSTCVSFCGLPFVHAQNCPLG